MTVVFLDYIHVYWEKINTAHASMRSHFEFHSETFTHG